ncbi:DUF2182 domain-containing protein [Burkholderia sp. Bp9017]|uniref:DUF2182 domain-containing protein n=1 Tax=unclassified Burkholderia TaxID=2613784 RepID=UPI003907F959
MPGAAILATAGAWPLSSLKGRCRDRCRPPMMFISQHWHGAHERRASFMPGFHDGLFCIGCCWALMLLMFAVGTASIAWMLALAATMGAEKTLSLGKEDQRADWCRPVVLGGPDRRRESVIRRTRAPVSDCRGAPPS